MMAVQQQHQQRRVRAAVMSWRRVMESLKAVAAHSLLFSFTLLLVFKLHYDAVSLPSYSWWIVFFPIWLFHFVFARYRFSVPAPSFPSDRHWAPFHAIAAVPLLVAFELLLCIYLDGSYAINLKVVFSPLLALETAIFIENVMMFKFSLPSDEAAVNDAAILKALPHLWIAFSMIFNIAATIFTLLKLCGDSELIYWWEIFLNYGFAQCFAFLTCTKWYNPAIHRHSHVNSASSSSTTVGYIDWKSVFFLSSNEDNQQSQRRSLQDVGGNIMKLLLILFQILLFLHLQVQLSISGHITIPIVFSPLLLLQGAGVFFTIFVFVEKVILTIHAGDGSGRYLEMSSIAQDIFAFMHHGSRLLGWWSIDEETQEELAQLYCTSSTCYNTFSPDVVKKLPRVGLVEEIQRLQAALSEQTETRKSSEEEYEKLQNEKILCQVCFEDQISTVLLPCRHHILCRSCCRRCKRCPICRIYIERRLCVNEV